MEATVNSEMAYWEIPQAALQDYLCTNNEFYWLFCNNNLRGYAWPGLAVHNYLHVQYMEECIILIAFGIITGIVSLKFPLSSQPDLGDWKIEVVYKVYTYDFFPVCQIIVVVVIVIFIIIIIITRNSVH